MGAKRVRQAEYSPWLIDKLAYAQCETVAAVPGTIVSYDVEFYERVKRESLATCEPPYFNPSSRNGRLGSRAKARQSTVLEPYLMRLGGFRRDVSFSPDGAAAALKHAGIQYADSIGNGLFEHLMLCRKYGIVPAFEAPAMEMPLPFLERQMPIFKKIYRKHLVEMRNWLRLVEKIYGHSIINRAAQPWTLWIPVSPLALFLISMRRDPEETMAELQAAAGTSRLAVDAATPKEQARQFKAWAFIRRQHMKVLKIMAELLRDAVADQGLIVGNMHTLPPVDYEMMGEAFDMPGVAVRPGYVKEPHLREGYVGYAISLFKDLCKRPPLVSVRTNITAAGTYCVAGPRAIKRWFDEAVRHGSGGFYLWPVDYPMGGSTYRGVMRGNPEPTNYGRERWESMLENCRTIASRQRFVPPPAEVGILVPYDVLDRQGWQRVMRTFLELRGARIWSQMFSARLIERDPKSLARNKLLVVPILPFASTRLTKQLENYVYNGGTLVVPDAQIGIHDLDGHRRPVVFGLEEESRPDGERPIGAGRVIILPNPALGRWERENNSLDLLARASALWKKVAGRLPLKDFSWVMDVSAEDLPRVSEKDNSYMAPRAEPEMRLRHYLYEHSSDWLMPYLQNPDTFTNEKGQRV